MSDHAARRTAMVDTQIRPSDVTKFPIIEAMLTVPREAFVPQELRDAAYVGKNLDLRDGRIMLEARTLAKILDALDISQDELVLDVASGLGYSAAVIARMAEAVVALEDDQTRADEAQANLSAQNVDNVVMHVGPLADGASEHGPYDVIIVQGGIEELPETLAAQLKEGGRIACIFMSGALGDVKIGQKSNGSITWRSAFNAGAPVLEGFGREREFAL